MLQIPLRRSLCMARPRLTKEAIAFIIECRDDPTQVYTLEDIAKLVEEKFGISVSLQAIGNNYRKYKSDKSITQISQPAIEDKTEISKKSVFKPKKIKQDVLQNFDKNTDNIDLEDLFKPAE